MRPRSRTVSLVLTTTAVLASLLLSAAPARAAAIVVNSLADGAPANNGACTLREAITNANGNDQSGSTDCAAGSGSDTITFTVTGIIVLTSELPAVTAAGGALTIQGPDADTLAISGDTLSDGTTTPNVRAISVDFGATLDVLDLAIVEAQPPGGLAFGGTIFNSGTLHVTRTIFFDNSSNGGGAINSTGTLTVVDSLLTGNNSTGGAGAIAAGGPTEITNSTFAFNNASAGGALYVSGVTTITGSTFWGNDGGAEGGAIYSFGLRVASNLTITNSTFFANTSSSGAGITTGGISTLTHVTLSGNVPTSAGGGTLDHFGGTATLRSTIIANNPTPGTDSCSGTFVDGGYNIDSTNTCGFAGTSLSNTDPLLEPLASNGGPTRTMALMLNSPAKDLIPPAANGCGITETEDRAGPRGPRDPGCDVGAFERTQGGDGDGGGGGGHLFTVAIVGDGDGTVTSSPAGIRCPGDCTQSTSGSMNVYVLTPHPAAGSVFTGWYGDCTGTGACVVDVAVDTFVAAWYSLDGTTPPPPPPPPPAGETHDLHASRLGKGRIVSEPAGIMCGSECTATLEEGTAVTLVANPHDGWRLKRWRFGCKGQGEVCTLEMDTNRRAQAVFVRTP